MRKPLYITEPSVIVRKQNTFYVVREEFKKQLPIEYISELFCMAPVTISSGASIYLMKSNIPVHFFGMYGNYLGSLYPKKYNLSGFVTVKQVENYLNIGKRLEIAKEMVAAILHNLRQSLKKYEESVEVPDQNRVDSARTVSELMEIEARGWKVFYSVVSTLSGEEFVRSRRPPKSRINSVISYANSLLYSKVLTAIFHTPLDPSISYLHEPSERRFSLSLDIADIFKPVFTVRIVLKMINNNELKRKYFEDLGGAIFLSSLGRKKVAKDFDTKLYTTLYFSPLKRKVSYAEIIRMEAYKLLKHVIGDKKYEAFRSRW